MKEDDLLHLLKRPSLDEDYLNELLSLTPNLSFRTESECEFRDD